MNYTQYNENEKLIFNNHFIHKTKNSKQEFENLINKFYQAIPLLPEQYAFVDSKKSSYKAFIAAGVKFDSHHVLWDLKTKDNLLTHFLSQQDFYIDSKSLHRLNFVHR